MKSLKLYLFITCVLFYNPGLLANIDSLKLALNASKVTEDRFEISYAIARKTLFSEPDTAFKYLYNVLQDSVQNTNSLHLAKCLNGLGVYYFNKSQFDSTIYFSGKALNIFLQNNDTANTISPRKNLALANRGLGKYNQALSEFFKILDYYKIKNNVLKIAGTLNDIGNTYSYLKDYKEAIKYQDEALRYLHDISNATLQGNVYNSIGYNFENLGQLDSAIVYYEKSLVFKLKSGNVYSIVNTRNNLCALIDYKQFPEKCEDCLKNLLTDQVSIGDKQGLARTYLNLSVQYSFYEDYDKAINYLDSTGYYLRFSNDIFLKQHYFDLYSKTLFQCGDYLSAYNYKDSLAQLNDSVFSFQKRKELLELDTRYLTQQKNDSILMLETANSIVLLQVQKQRWQMFFLILLIVAVLGGGVFLMLYIKQRQEKLRDMALVRMREAERVRIARDMHDEVGSGLTRISLISEQVKMQNGDDAGLKNEHVSKIITQSRLLSRNLKEIIWAVDPSNDKMSELMFYLRDYIYEFSSNTSIKCKIDFQEDILDFEVASEVRRNLFLALKEMLNNVAKHANAKAVSIKFDIKNNLGYLQVKDNGIGFSATAVKKGVGLGSIKSRTEKLGGDFYIESKTGEGTSIYLKNLVLNTTKM